MFRNFKGFSLPEVMIGMGMISLVALGGMQLYSNQRDSTQGINNLSDLNRLVREMDVQLQDPATCRKNFAGKSEGAVLESLLATTDRVLLNKTSDSNIDPYVFTAVKVEKVDPLRKRALISFDFTRTSKGQRASSVKKFTSIFVTGTGTQITDCMDYSNVSSLALVEKLCWDADPMNFDADSSNDNLECMDNVSNLVSEVKRLYCSNNPLLTYVGGKCVPVDSNRICPGGSYLRGYTATGALDCYTPPSTPPTPSCTDSSWSPDASTVCSGTSLSQTSNCGNSRSVTGTKTDGSCAACTDSSWSPDVSTVCSGTGLTQTSNCGNSRSMTGTKTDGSCCTDSSWTPSSDPAATCSTAFVAETSNCGTTRNNVLKGTKTCNTCPGTELSHCECYFYWTYPGAIESVGMGNITYAACQGKVSGRYFRCEWEGSCIPD